VGCYSHELQGPAAGEKKSFPCHCKEMFSNNTYMSSIYSIAKDQARSCGFVVIQGEYKFSYLFQTLNLQSRAF